MRKFLLIFFLLFPIYGACGEVNEEKKPEEIQELFGIKFGNNCNEYVTLEPNSDMYNTKGKVPNKLFKSHIIYCTSLTKRVWKIFTGTIFESETLDELEICKKNLRSLENHFSEKYGIKLEVKEDRNYEYKLQNNQDDIHNQLEMRCTRVGTGKHWSSVRLNLIVTNLKMVSEGLNEDKQLSAIDKKGL